ncbi:MAG: hypothetical protein HYS38_03485 [Acidobacteria bacterium]|nr:hypothetical protein [Acidobacteriota bacterium]
MELETSEWTAVIGRLEKLEKQNRRLKQLGGLALLLTASVFLMGQAPRTRTIEANYLVLKDYEGRERIRFHSQYNDGPTIDFLDATGKRRLEIKVERDVQGIFLYDKEGSQIQGSLALSDDVPFIELYDPQGLEKRARQLAKDREEMDREKDRGKWIELARKSIRQEFPGSKFIVSAAPEGPTVELKDSGGFKTTIGTADLETIQTGETHKTSAASVVLFDKDGKVIWKAP